MSTTSKLSRSSRVRRPPRNARSAASGGSSRWVASPRHARDRAGHQLRARQMREVDEVDAVGERSRRGRVRSRARAASCRCLQPRSASPAASRRAAAPPARPARPRAPRRRRGRREMPSRAQLGRLDGERRVLLEDRPLQLLQRGPGLEAELRRASRRRARRNTSSAVGLPVAPVEGEHQLPAEPLAALVLGDQRLELGDEIAMAPEREVGLDPVLERRQPQLLQPRSPQLARTPRSARPRRPAHATARAPRESSTPPRRPPPAASSDRPRATRSSNRSRSSSPDARRSRYPGPSRSIRSGPSRRRNPCTCTCRAFTAAAGGRSPHSASISRSRDTTSPRATSRHASSATCLPGRQLDGARCRWRPARARARGTPGVRHRAQPSGSDAAVLHQMQDKPCILKTLQALHILRSETLLRKPSAETGGSALPRMRQEFRMEVGPSARPPVSATMLPETRRGQC